MTLESIASRICCTLSTIQKWDAMTTVSRAIAANLDRLDEELRGEAH